MTMDYFVEFFHIFHSTDQTLCKQNNGNGTKNVNIRRQTKRTMLMSKDLLLLDANP